MGGIMLSRYKYQAFISYAHSDEDQAARLQRTLERFRVPKPLRGNQLSRISPIFRDVTELTAHHSLSTKIEDAIHHSRFLIVLCSPAAKNSKWVNEEIRLFQNLHGEASVLCALIEGTPETSFPPALIEQGREPLAANLSPKNFRLGSLQVAASILGVGLDDLVQRQAKLRRLRMYAITTASLAFSGLMAVSAWNAVSARNQAQESYTAAENSRNEAEKLIEFMLDDLTDALDALGDLTIIDNVGLQVSAYYDAIPLSDMNNEHLARRARSRHLLGQVAIAQGKADQAFEGLNKARTVTAELLSRAPNDSTALQTHAQSEYSLLRAYETQNPERAIEYGLSYKALSKRLYETDKSNLEYMAEYALAHNKLGQIYQTLKEPEKAKAQFSQAANLYREASHAFPNSDEIKFELITLERNLAIIEHKQGHHETAITALKLTKGKNKALLLEDPDNFNYRISHFMTHYWLQDIQISNLNLCKANEIYDLAAELESMMTHDPSAEAWKSSFINFAHSSIQSCEAVLSDAWIKDTTKKTRKVFALLENKTRQLTEKNTWLEQY